jgi:hypothetical protein
MIPAMAEATIEELEYELKMATNIQDKPLAVSILNTLLWKIGNTNNEKRLDYLYRKYHFLLNLDLPKLADEVLNEIIKLDPNNMILKLRYVKSVLE